jgi:hypothetical protein
VRDDFRDLRRLFPTQTAFIVAQCFNEETALQVTSRLCFLALNGDDPPKKFWFFIDESQGLDPRACTMSAYDLATGFGMEPRDFLIGTYKNVPSRRAA